MRTVLGWCLIVSGALTLVFNEVTVQARRVWPWRRDDSDPVRDEALNERYRISVFIAAIAAIEIGRVLADAWLGDLSLRITLYVVVGLWLLWGRARRERLRSQGEQA